MVDAMGVPALASSDAGRAARPAVVCVAVSGGPDSTALGLLVHRWVAAAAPPAAAAAPQPRVVVLCVDHRLRASSGPEVADVRAQFEARGIAVHSVQLQWPDGVPRAGKLAEASRNARYGALLAMCRALGAK
jgi:tRNA(Ile)-lysidine synthase